jgi:polyhydroxyalkanoate synthase
MVPVQTSAMFRPLEAQMEGSPSPNDPSAHLANLMHAGQQSMKQFEDALAAAMGVPGKRATPMGRVFSPFAFISDMQREYLTQFWRSWSSDSLRCMRLAAFWGALDP